MGRRGRVARAGRLELDAAIVARTAARAVGGAARRYPVEGVSSPVARASGPKAGVDG